MPKLENTKYERWYTSLIAKARSTRSLYPKTENTEKHHIIPRCVGGTDEESNLARLSIREHYIAHLLLIKMYDGEEKYKLEWALFSLAGKPSRKIVLTSRQFEKCRSTLHNSMRGKKQSEAHVAKRSKLIIGEGNGMHRSKGKKHPLLGVPMSEETKKKISDAHKRRIEKSGPNPRIGTTLSEETKKKISLAKKGKKMSDQAREKLIKAITGKVRTEETKQKIRDKVSASWEITLPTGEIIVVRGLSPYCKEHNWNYANVMYAIRADRPFLGYRIKRIGKISKLRGTKLSEETKAKISTSRMGVSTITEEQRKKLSERMSGRKHYYYGKPRSDEDRKKISEARGADPVIVEHKDGRIATVTNRNEFAREHDLDCANLISMIKGRLKTHKGWKLYVPPISPEE